MLHAEKTQMNRGSDEFARQMMRETITFLREDGELGLSDEEAVSGSLK